MKRADLALAVVKYDSLNGCVSGIVRFLPLHNIPFEISTASAHSCELLAQLHTNIYFLGISFDTTNISHGTIHLAWYIDKFSLVELHNPCLLYLLIRPRVLCFDVLIDKEWFFGFYNRNIIRLFFDIFKVGGG